MKKKRELGEVFSQPLLFTFATSLTMGFVLSNPDISTSLTSRVEGKKSMHAKIHHLRVFF